MHRKSRASSIGCLWGIAAIAAITIYMMFALTWSTSSIDPAIRNEILLRERAKTQDELHRISEQQIRRERLTETATFASKAGLWMIVVITGFIAVSLTYALRAQNAATTRMEIYNSNMERFKSAGNGQYLLDVETSEVLDLDHGTITTTGSTPAKLAAYSQRQRIEALGDVGQRWNVAMSKAALGAYRQRPFEDYQIETAEPPQIEQQEFDLIDMYDAYEASNDKSWIVGQNQDTGVVCRYSPYDMPHAALHGATNRGKTYGIGFAMIAHARRCGWHVIVLDGKGGQDFAPTQNVAHMYEHCRMTSHNVAGLISGLHQYMESDQYVGNVLIVVEELGRTMASLKEQDRFKLKSERQYPNFITHLDDILSVGRGKDMHMLMIDQHNSVWSESMKTNAEAVFTFGMPPYRLQSIAPSLQSVELDRYQFWYSDNDGVFNSFNWKSDDVYSMVGKQDAPRLLNESVNRFTVYDMGRGNRLNTPPLQDSDLQIYSSEAVIYDDLRNPVNHPVNPVNRIETIDDALQFTGKERHKALASISPRMKLPPATCAEKRFIYQAYIDLDQSPTDTCYYVCGSVGSNYAALKKTIEEYNG